ncbi:helix-turn-helix transcriptional regulator [Symbiopectobacterium sp. RP]|uniref:helix-turn-helix transcriptional regulator n=1 Tax=Symbiopectobacterium sp. RP TaxID=3248553 RepID=UPI003D2BE00B
MLIKSEHDVEEVIKKQLEATLNTLETFTWAYVVLSKKDMSCIFGVTNYPDEWVKHYRENGLQYTDPVVITALKRLTPFPWNEKLMAHSGYDFAELFNQASEYEVVDGYTFVLHDYNNNLVTLSFIIPSERKTIIMKTLLQNKGDISMLLAAVHETYLTLTPFSEKKTEDSNKAKQLTKREREILYWTSVGKTYQETGIILGIKVRTVKFHMLNIVKKMGVANARHAVRLGVELRLIQPVK